MKASRIKLGLLATIATLALPSSALAAYLVPPGNSAATQYTEAYPTAGGNREAGGGGERDRSPSEVLGSRNADKLYDQGPDGRAAAAVAAATAPSGTAPNGGAANPSGSDPNGARSQPGSGADGDGVSTDRSNGSSGIGEVIGQATGSSSSGGLGLLLPLALLATAAWALAFLWRQRRRPAP